jgi:ADP-ribose pyrophosphatase
MLGGDRMPLPPISPIELSTEEDLSPAPPHGFLRLHRARMRLQYADGAQSEPFVYDTIARDALDAVVVAAHYQDGEGRRCVYLRTAVRPPLRLRPMEVRPFPEKATLGVLWELPAGLVEADECSIAGVRRCAARELGEELGFVVSPDELVPLGPSTFPLPGAIGERHHFFHVEVSPERRETPSEDGSVLEQRATIATLPLSEAIRLAAMGELEDSKTELALRRLVDALSC